MQAKKEPASLKHGPHCKQLAGEAGLEPAANGLDKCGNNFCGNNDRALSI